MSRDSVVTKVCDGYIEAAASQPWGPKDTSFSATFQGWTLGDGEYEKVEELVYRALADKMLENVSSGQEAFALGEGLFHWRQAEMLTSMDLYPVTVTATAEDGLATLYGLA
jgi:hypothetical protein